MTTVVVVHASNANFATTVRQDDHDVVKLNPAEVRSFSIDEDKTAEKTSRFEVTTSWLGDPLSNEEENPNQPEGIHEPTETEKRGNPGLADRKNK